MSSLGIYKLRIGIQYNSRIATAEQFTRAKTYRDRVGAVYFPVYVAAFDFVPKGMPERMNSNRDLAVMTLLNSLASARCA